MIKIFSGVINENSQLVKSIPINKEINEILEKHRVKFMKRYGREPGKGDKIFFDMPEPDEVRRLTIEAMHRAGIDPALIYAYSQTGLIVTESNKSLISERDLAEWDAAIDEYDNEHSEEINDLEAGDWVIFRTKNWPPDAVRFTSSGDGSVHDATGEGLYMGRGKIIEVKPEGWLVQEEGSKKLVEVGSDERVELMDDSEDFHRMTLGDLRRFMEEHKEAPDNTPIMVLFPVGFTCDEDSHQDLPDDHPESHTPDIFHMASLSNVVFYSVEEMAERAGQEDNAGEEMHAGPQIEFVIHSGDAHSAMRDCDDE